MKLVSKQSVSCFCSAINYCISKFFPHGFKRPQCAVKANSTINVSELEEQLDRFVSLGFAEKTGDGYNVDLTAANIDKLLGNGILHILNEAVQGLSFRFFEKHIVLRGRDQVKDSH